MDYPKVSIVTPCFNHGGFLEETILSVISQGYPNLEYIIIDGGSTDNSVDIIRKYEQHIAYWISEKDRGLYDALNKGFARSTGEVMGWINADDLLHRKSLFVVGEIFKEFPQAEWLQGFPTVVDQLGRIVFHRPARHSRYSFYLKEYHDGTYIQQESTYWRRSLWTKAGSKMTGDLKYAGDFELWMRFFDHAKMFIISALIGAFRVHGKAQLSAANADQYVKECDTVVDAALAKLSINENKKLQTIRRLRSIQHRFGLIGRLIKVNTGIQKLMNDSLSVDFDLTTQKFVLQK